MKKILSFGEMSYHMIYPLIIIFVISAINKSKLYLKAPVQENSFLITSIGLMFLGETLAGCLYFVSRHKKRMTNYKINLHQKSQLKKTKITAISSDYTQKYTVPIIALIFGLGAIDLTSSVVNYSSKHFAPLTNKQYAADIYQVILFAQFFIYTALAVLLLKQETNRHHYVAFAIFTIGGIIVLIPIFIKQFEWLLIINLGRQCLNGLFYTMDKWVMHYKRIDPFFLLLLQGIFGFVIFVLLLVIELSLCPYEDLNWYCNDIHFFDLMTPNGVVFIFIEFFKFIAVNICIVQTIRYYSPLHLLGTYAFSMIFDWVFDTCEGDPIEPMVIIGYVIMSVGYAIYNEIVLLHFCELDKDTKKMIRLRGMRSVLLDVDMELQHSITVTDENESLYDY